MYKYAKKKKKESSSFLCWVSMLDSWVVGDSICQDQPGCWEGCFILDLWVWSASGMFIERCPEGNWVWRLRKGFRLMYSWVGELTPGRGERREEDFHENLWNANMWGLRRENGAHTGIWEETARSAGTKKNEHMTSRNARAKTISWRCEWSTGWNLQRGKEN